MVRPLDAYRVYLFIQAGITFSWRMMFTVFLFYFVQEVGLNPFQLVLTGTALELAIVLFEVPTGVVADVYSRRLSIIIGLAIAGMGILMTAIPIFGVVLLAQMILGLGYTFTSGATNAWLTDEIGEEAANRAFLRGSQVSQATLILTIIVSVLLALIDLRLPIVIAGLGSILLGLVLAIIMPENGFTPTPSTQRDTWGSMRGTLSDGVRMIQARPILINILILSFMIGTFSEGYDRLWTAHLVRNIGLPKLGGLDEVVWIGIIGIVGTLLSITGTEIISRRVDTQNQGAIIRTLQATYLILILGMLTFAHTPLFPLALLMLWLIGVGEPLYAAWVNQGLDPSTRATVFSIAAQANGFGELTGGPVIGGLANLTSLRVALTGSALLLLPTLGLIRSTLYRHESGYYDLMRPAND
jgi:DHA3 family tetracycline resistance protein-like MFS transporter